MMNKYDDSYERKCIDFYLIRKTFVEYFNEFVYDFFLNMSVDTVSKQCI